MHVINQHSTLGRRIINQVSALYSHTTVVDLPGKALCLRITTKKVHMIERSVPLITETSDGICTSVKIEKVNDSADQTKFSSCVYCFYKNSSPLAITVVSLHTNKMDVLVNLKSPRRNGDDRKHLYDTELHNIEQASWKITVCAVE